MLNSDSLNTLPTIYTEHVSRTVLISRFRQNGDMNKGVVNSKNKLAFEKMRYAGYLLAQLFEQLVSRVAVGVSTGELDAFILSYLNKHDMISQTIGYRGYRHASCISINDEVVHGVPSMKRTLHSGDIVTIDVCAAWDGHCVDMARCFFVGEVKPSLQRLVRVAGEALDAGIAQMYPGKRVGDVSSAIQRVVEGACFGVVRDFAGHGIGMRMHEDPEILNYGVPGTGPLIEEGKAFAVEPMITEGSYHVYVERDGWTVKTVDRRCAAHVEDTILITADGPEVVTRLK